MKPLMLAVAARCLKNTGSEVVHAIEVLLNNQNFFQPIRNDAPVW